MFVVRFLVLAFLVAYGIGLGQEPALNGFGKLMVFSLIFTVPAMYFLPSIEAALHGAPNKQAIFVLNLFLGWSVIGWVVAMVWAFRKPEPVAAPTPDAGTPQPRSTPAAAEARPMRPAAFSDELAKLADLKDRGALSAEEFAEQKARLLRRSSGDQS
jgi:hypothetical protein